MLVKLIPISATRFEEILKDFGNFRLVIRTGVGPNFNLLTLAINYAIWQSLNVVPKWPKLKT